MQLCYLVRSVPDGDNWDGGVPDSPVDYSDGDHPGDVVRGFPRFGSLVGSWDTVPSAASGPVHEIPRLSSVFSVTRLTAKARAANECTNRELRRLTLRQAPAWTAWTIRRCRDRTRRWQAAQLIRCHALIVRSEDACSSGLRMGNRASVRGLLRRSRPITPVGSQPPCGVEQSLHPYPPHYRVAFASSHVPYRLRHPLCSRSGDSGGLCLALPQRAKLAYHVWRVSPTSRGRMPLCTGRVNGCVGSP